MLNLNCKYKKSFQQNQHVTTRTNQIESVKAFLAKIDCSQIILINLIFIFDNINHSNINLCHLLIGLTIV